MDSTRHDVLWDDDFLDVTPAPQQPYQTFPPAPWETERDLDAMPRTAAQEEALAICLAAMTAAIDALRGVSGGAHLISGIRSRYTMAHYAILMQGRLPLPRNNAQN